MAAAAVAPKPVSAQVGNAFVQQYYHILHQSPGLVHRFYQDISKLGRPEEDGSMSITTTMDAINAKILSVNYGDFMADIRSIDAQESLNGGVHVLVTGYHTGEDNTLRNFAQSFFLAPQDKGYFVLNDIFRYMENANDNEGDHAATEDAVDPVTPEEASEVVPVLENDVPENVAVSTDESSAEEVLPVDNGDVPAVEDDPVSEVIDEVQGPLQQTVESNTKTEEAPKKSYASIVMDLKQNGVPFSSLAPAPRKSQPRKQEQHLNNALSSTVVAEAAATDVDAVENGIHEEEAEGYSVYVKGLPMSATPALLEEEFKKFGLIKANGIQVRSNRQQQQGFCFGFVEFEVPEAVQKAIEASPVSIGGRNAVVEEKRSTNSRVPGFSNLFTADDNARIAHLLGLPEIDRTFGSPGSDSVETMSGTGKATLRFGLEDIECHVESRAKETERKEKSPVEEKPNSRVKMVKRKKEPDSRLVSLFVDRDFEGVGDMAFDVLDMMFKRLRSDRQKMEEEIARAKAEVEAKGKEIEVLRADMEKEVATAVEEARDAASLAVLHAKIKIAKEAVDPAFDRAAWDVSQWEFIAEELMGELNRKAAMVPRR